LQVQKTDLFLSLAPLVIALVVYIVRSNTFADA
jgi:hypothetical protein